MLPGRCAALLLRQTSCLRCAMPLPAAISLLRCATRGKGG